VAKVEVIQDLGITQVILGSESTAADIATVHSEIERLGQSTGIRLVLVDGTASVKVPSFSELQELVSTVPKGIRLAAILGSNPASRHGIKYAELTAGLQGHVFKAFESRKDATLWLNRNDNQE
jgi:hypothetical protein